MNTMLASALMYYTAAAGKRDPEISMGPLGVYRPGDHLENSALRGVNDAKPPAVPPSEPARVPSSLGAEDRAFTAAFHTTFGACHGPLRAPHASGAAVEEARWTDADQARLDLQRMRNNPGRRPRPAAVAALPAIAAGSLGQEWPIRFGDVTPPADAPPPTPEVPASSSLSTDVAPFFPANAVQTAETAMALNPARFRYAAHRFGDADAMAEEEFYDMMDDTVGAHHTKIACPRGKPLVSKIAGQPYTCSLCGDDGAIPAGEPMFSCADPRCGHAGALRDYHACRACYEHGRRVYVSGMARGAKMAPEAASALENMLRNAGVEWARVENVGIMADPKTHMNRGFAYITTPNLAQADKVCAALNGQKPTDGDTVALGPGPLRAEHARIDKRKE